MAAWVIAAFFAVWAIGSILVLVPGVGERIRSRDLIGLLPEWKFFAPIPGKGDFHYLFRDRYGEMVADWTEVYVGGSRRWWNCVWNPHRRDRKAALDAARQLLELSRSVKESELFFTVPYLTLLTHISNLPRTFLPSHTQFSVLYSDAAVESGLPKITLVSHVHPLRDELKVEVERGRGAALWHHREQGAATAE